MSRCCTGRGRRCRASSSPTPEVPRPRRTLLDADREDLVGVRACRGDHVDHVALALAHQRARDRRGDRDAPGADVRLVLADDLVDDLWPSSWSSSSTSTPKITLPVLGSLPGSITSAVDSLPSISLMRPSMKPCCSRAAWYSAFSDRSPWPRASAIALMTFGRASDFRRFSSARSASAPRSVMGVRLMLTCAPPARAGPAGG